MRCGRPVPGLRDPGQAGPLHVLAHGGRTPFGEPEVADTAARAPVLLRPRPLRAADVRRAGPGAERASPALPHRAEGVAACRRHRARRPRGRAAVPQAQRRGRPHPTPRSAGSTRRAGAGAAGARRRRVRLPPGPVPAAPCWSTSRPAASSTSCPTAPHRPSRPGCASTRARKSSAATAPAPTAGRSRRPRRPRSRSPTAGTCCRTCPPRSRRPATSTAPAYANTPTRRCRPSRRRSTCRFSNCPGPRSSNVPATATRTSTACWTRSGRSAPSPDTSGSTARPSAASRPLRWTNSSPQPGSSAPANRG
ncbi:hypothetical protein BX266_0027 [Streptomyces sp. TLI_171]|nr:hypothetical protein BX266_7220 [Streptomyces sp. TLI_171]RKE16796.1 hypothetical protein BX266_0027 [Streptomyces sp. TLI_171]